MYTSEVSWQQELWRLLPTILLIGGYVWFTRRQLGGLGGGGSPGSRGIFNVGKASVTMLDKNAKNKVTFADVAGCDEAKVGAQGAGARARGCAGPGRGCVAEGALWGSAARHSAASSSAAAPATVPACPDTVHPAHLLNTPHHILAHPTPG